MNIKWTDKFTKEEQFENRPSEVNRKSDKGKNMELDWLHIT
jgi:hypothetical protein